MATHSGLSESESEDEDFKNYRLRHLPQCGFISNGEHVYVSSDRMLIIRHGTSCLGGLGLVGGHGEEGLSGVSYATFRLEHPEDALSVLYAGLSAPNQHPCCAMRAQNLYLVNLIRGGICTRSGEMCSLTEHDRRKTPADKLQRFTVLVEAVTTRYDLVVNCEYDGGDSRNELYRFDNCYCNLYICAYLGTKGSVLRLEDVKYNCVSAWMLVRLRTLVLQKRAVVPKRRESHSDVILEGSCSPLVYLLMLPFTMEGEGIFRRVVSLLLVRKIESYR